MIQIYIYMQCVFAWNGVFCCPYQKKRDGCSSHRLHLDRCYVKARDLAFPSGAK